MTEAVLNTFRVHFHDGDSLDIDAAAPMIAEARARKQRPGSFVKKVKLVREVGSKTGSKGISE